MTEGKATRVVLLIGESRLELLQVVSPCSEQSEHSKLGLKSKRIMNVTSVRVENSRG